MNDKGLVEMQILMQQACSRAESALLHSVWGPLLPIVLVLGATLEEGARLCNSGLHPWQCTRITWGGFTQSCCLAPEILF